MHLFSMAGVAEMLCDNGAGDLVLQLRQFDDFGFGEYYKCTVLYDDLNRLIETAEFQEHYYDKIVIHDFHEFKDRFPKDKVILIFHGSKLRAMPDIELEQVKRYPCFITSQELFHYLPNAVYLPNPVDLKLFKPEYGKVLENDYFCINRSYQRDFIEKKIRERYPNIEYYERNAKSIVKYEDMPQFLGQHSNYVDWKFDYSKPEPLSLHDPSCIGLQALALGCNVYDNNGIQLQHNILAIHDAKQVAKGFMKEIDSN